MPTPIAVRRACEADHASIAELTARVYLTEGWGDEQYEPVLRDVAGRAQSADLLVAVDEGRVVGAVTVVTRGGPYAEQAEDGDAVIRMLVTDPAVRGRGTGEALVRACLDLAVAAGCTRVRLSTQPGMAAAHRLYARLGFVRRPEDDWSPHEGVDLLAYTLDLPRWCSTCGEPAHGPHGELEPPRYCPRCRRRMVVQVLPAGWSARCVEHGLLTGQAGPATASVRPPAPGGAARP